jgi:predicted enzyme related to lactoylglutathione lyase
MNKPTFQAIRDVIIQVEDMQRALKFYGETLGLKISKEYGHCTGFEAGGVQLFVEQGKRPGPVFEFLVPDLQAAKQKLLAAGCEIVEEDPELPRLYLRDPYGLTFNLSQR